MQIKCWLVKSRLLVHEFFKLRYFLNFYTSQKYQKYYFLSPRVLSSSKCTKTRIHPPAGGARRFRSRLRRLSKASPSPHSPPLIRLGCRPPPHFVNRGSAPDIWIAVGGNVGNRCLTWYTANKCRTRGCMSSMLYLCLTMTVNHESFVCDTATDTEIHTKVNTA